MGDKSTLRINNVTTKNLALNHQHSYQMNAWSPPQSIKANHYSSFEMDWNETFWKNMWGYVGDDGAEAFYTLEGASLQLDVYAHAKIASANYSSTVPTYTYEFNLWLRNTWKAPSDGPLGSPHHVQRVNGGEWFLMSKNRSNIGASKGTNTIDFVEVDQFADNYKTIVVISAIINEDKSSADLKEFTAAANAKIKTLGKA